MTLAETDTPEGEPSGDPQFQEAVQLPGVGAPAPPPGVDDPIDLGRRTAVREAQFRSVTVEVSVWIGCRGVRVDREDEEDVRRPGEAPAG
jgi:hypothetical protein